MRQLRSSVLSLIVATMLLPRLAFADGEPTPTPNDPHPAAVDCLTQPENPHCKEKSAAPATPNPPTDKVADKADDKNKPAANSGSSSGGVGNLGGGSCSGGGGGGDAGIGLLAVAVIAAAALPLIVYLLDDDISEQDRALWKQPHLRFELMGGVATTTSNYVWVPVAGGRWEGSLAYFALDADVESALDPQVYSTAGAHLQVRPVPKQHLDVAIAVGARHLESQLGNHDGFDISVPARYVFGREGAKQPGLEVIPSVLIYGKQGADWRLDLNGVLPLGNVVELNAGAKLFSVDKQVEFGALGGFAVHI